jgi:hypothetical protein
VTTGSSPTYSQTPMRTGTFQSHALLSSPIGAKKSTAAGTSPSWSQTWTAGPSMDAGTSKIVEKFSSHASPPMSEGTEISTAAKTSPSHSQTWTSLTSGSEDPPLFFLSSTTLQELLVEDELMANFTSQVSFYF